MWTRRSYDALYRWVEGEAARKIARKTMLADGLDDVVARLDNAATLGVWYRITQEAAGAVGPNIIEASAKVAEMELNEMAAALGRKGGSVKSDRKTAASRENGKKGGRPGKEIKP